MYAIIESCGKQYKVAKGDVVFFEKLDAEVDKKYTFDKVVLVSEDGKVQIGNPYVKGVKVEGKVISHGKHKKIIVYKMKPQRLQKRKKLLQKQKQQKKQQLKLQKKAKNNFKSKIRRE